MASEILDSRGDPTVEAELIVADGSWARVAAPYFRYIGRVYAHVLPVPMITILNGGAHTAWQIHRCAGIYGNALRRLIIH